MPSTYFTSLFITFRLGTNAPYHAIGPLTVESRKQRRPRGEANLNPNDRRRRPPLSSFDRRNKRSARMLLCLTCTLLYTCLSSLLSSCGGAFSQHGIITGPYGPLFQFSTRFFACYYYQAKLHTAGAFSFPSPPLLISLFCVCRNYECTMFFQSQGSFYKKEGFFAHPIFAKRHKSAQTVTVVQGEEGKMKRGLCYSSGLASMKKDSLRCGCVYDIELLTVRLRPEFCQPCLLFSSGASFAAKPSGMPK